MRGAGCRRAGASAQVAGGALDHREPLLAGLERRLGPRPLQGQQPAIRHRLDRDAGRFELAQVHFAAGRFTAADLMMSFPVEMAALRGSKTRPATADWLSRIHARPAYARALEKGGPYEVGR